MDAGDWISLGSLVIAAGSVLLGLSQARKSAGAAEASAVNAKKSADAAAAMVPVAERTAEAAAESAGAAHRSADAAEAQLHREGAPVWKLDTGRANGEGLVTATMMSGPSGVRLHEAMVGGSVYGKLAMSGRMQSEHTFSHLEADNMIMHKGSTIELPVPFPPEFEKIHEFEATVALTTSDADAEERSDAKRWQHAETVRWKLRQAHGF